MPVLLVIYDARADVAYWLYVQAQFEGRTGFNPKKLGKQVTVHVPRANVVDQAAMRQFAAYRDQVLTQTRGVAHHG